MDLWNKENIDKFKHKEREIERLQNDVNNFLKENSDMLNNLLTNAPDTSSNVSISDKPFQGKVISFLNSYGNYRLQVGTIRSIIVDVLSANGIMIRYYTGGIANMCVGIDDIYIDIGEITKG